MTWSSPPDFPFIIWDSFSFLSVDAGATLTFSPGTVVKFVDTRRMEVNGRLVAQGTQAAPIVFTSIKDDAHGGDTNGDGNATSPAPGNWAALVFMGSSNGSVLDHTWIGYGGYASYGDVQLYTSDITVTNNTFTNSSNYGLRVSGVNPAHPLTLNGNTFLGNTQWAVYDDSTGARTNITLVGNTSSGSQYNGYGVKGTVAGTVTWSSPPDFPFIIWDSFSYLSVDAGATLTFSPGAVIKFVDVRRLEVNGRLVAQGTQAAPIVFTSIKDDAHGGDTNGDGAATSPAPGNWAGVALSASSSGSVLEHTWIGYGGYGGATYAYANLYLYSNDATIRESTITKSANRGITVSSAQPRIESNTIRENPVGVYCLNGAQPKVWANRIEDNSSYGVQNMAPATPVDARNNWWGDASGPTYPATNPGGSGDVVSDGVLFSPWIEALAWRAPEGDLLHGMTTIAWDIYGRDTSSISVKVTAATPTQTLTLGEGLAPDGELAWNSAVVGDGWITLRAHAFEGATLVDEISRDVLVLNRAGIAFHAGTVTANETWGAGVLHILLDDVTLATGVQVTVAPGSLIKAMRETALLVRNGAILDAQGIPGLPIVFTSFYDDSTGGDSNLDGTATVPRPGDWYGIVTEGTGQFLSTADTFIRYFQRTHSGALTTHQTWEGGAVHRVTGEVTVPNGVRLTIAPGAIVKFDKAQGITVQTGGELVAQGTLGAPIAFTSVRDDTLGGDSNLDGALTAPAPGDWRGILTSGGGQVSLAHALLRYGGRTGSSAWTSTSAAVATASGGTIRVESSAIRDPYYEGVIAWGSGTVVLTNTVIAGADRGVNSDGAATVRLTNCTLDDNRVGVYGHGGALSIANTIIANSLDYGMDNVLSSPVVIRYSDVWSLQGVDYYHMADQTGVSGNVSVDPAFKNRAAGVFLLQYASPVIDAADGGVAPLTDALGAPRYDDPRTVNTGLPASGGAYADMGAYEFVETADSPVDLVVTRINAPLDLLAGEWVTVSWTVRNDGTEAVTGPWTDAISLVQSPGARPTTTPVAETQVGAGVTLAPGHPYVASARVRVPGATVGEQFWQVMTNARAEIFEGRNITNNTTLAAHPALLDVATLVVDGGAVSGAFTDSGLAQWYRFTPEPGQSVRLELDLTGAGATTALFVGASFVPTRETYDVRSPEWQLPDSTLAVAETIPTTYYVLATGTAPGVYQIALSTLDFSLSSVSPSTGGNAGQVTLLIRGAALPVTPTVTLIHPTAGSIPALATQRLGADRVAATFDLRGVAPAVTGVQVAQGAVSRTLAGAFTIIAGGAPDFWWSLEGPELIRAGRPNAYTVHWGNQGAVDAPAQLVALRSSSAVTMTLFIAETGEMLDNGFQFLALEADAALPTLPPGSTGSFHFSVVSDGFSAFTLEARAGAVNDPVLAAAPVDWEAFRDEVKPEDLTDAEWDTVYDALIADLGANWAALGETLAEDAHSVLRAPDAPLYPRSEGVPLRMPMLVALGRAAASVGWITAEEALPGDFMATLAGPPGRLLSLSVTVSGYEHAREINLPGVALDRETIRNYVMHTAQGLPGNHTDLHQPIGSAGALRVATMRAEVQRLANAATDRDTLFLYFAGHGRDVGFVDAMGASYYYWDFVSDIRNTRARRVVVVVDACHSGGLIDEVQSDPSNPVLENRLTIVTAASTAQTAGEGPDGGGYLTSEYFGRLRGYNPQGLNSMRTAYTAMPPDIDPDAGPTDIQNPHFYGPDITLHDPTARSKEPIVRNLNGRAPLLPGARWLRGASGGGADPNDKVSGGYGEAGWMAAGQPLRYTIHFENIAPEGVDPDLIWPAQEVVVTDVLSPDLDWSTFALGPVGFNNTVVSVPAGRSTFQGITAVSTDSNPVMVTATLHAETGLVTWRIHSYDDLTGQLPEDPLAGFLPANDETHAGEGYVTFSIWPRSGLLQGARVANRASIIFDVNDPILTNVVTNTVDTAPPTSAVTPLPATVNQATFPVSWSGSDGGGAGVALYDVYVSDNGGAFVLWQAAITTTQTLYAGANGHTYGFYCVATDYVGQREVKAPHVEAQTLVGTSAERKVYLPMVLRQ